MKVQRRRSDPKKLSSSVKMMKQWLSCSTGTMETESETIGTVKFSPQEKLAVFEAVSELDDVNTPQHTQSSPFQKRIAVTSLSGPRRTVSGSSSHSTLVGDVSPKQNCHIPCSPPFKLKENREPRRDLSLRYLFLYYDYVDIGGLIFETPRRHLAQFSATDTIPSDVPLSQLRPRLFPSLAVLHDKYSTIAPFYLIKAQLDLAFLPYGEFKNILRLEAQRQCDIECTTTIYSFGQKIYEIVQVSRSSSETSSPDTCEMHQIDFAPEFFTAFLNGFLDIFLGDMVQIVLAVRNLSVVQIYRQAPTKSGMTSFVPDESFEETFPSLTISSDDTWSGDEEGELLLCLAYEFDAGNGTVEMQRILGD